MLPLFANRSIDSAGNLPSPYLIDWTRQVVSALSVPATTTEPDTGPQPSYLLDSTAITSGAGISVLGSLASGAVVVGLAQLADSGVGALLGITRDAYGRVSGTTDATITGTAGEIDVADGDAVAGPPTLSLADVTDVGGGTLQKTAFDTKGRKTGTSAATTSDLTEGTNLYYTDERAVDAAAAALTDSATVTWAYNDTTGEISATAVGGTVTSVGMTVPDGFAITGSPVTTTGTLAVAYDTGYQGYTSAESTKLAGIASGATANSSDATLLARANHTGTQTASTISDFSTAADLRVQDGIASTITNGDTTHAPSGDAVFDALALKGNLSGGNTWVSAQIFTAAITVDYSGATGFQVITTNDRNAVCRYAINSGANNVYAGQGTADVFGIGNSSNLNASSNCWLRVSNGSTCHGLDNTGSSGEASARWTVVYAATGAINTSDAREKTPVATMTPAEIAVAADLSREIGTYQWLASIAEKGDDARHHVGITVQRAIEVMQLHGLDPFRYGFICHDEWDEQQEIVEEGEVTQEYRPAGDRYSFRHDELLLFLARGFAARLDAAGL